MTVLMPVICWKTARKTAIPSGLRSRFAKSSRSVPASCAIVSRISRELEAGLLGAAHPLEHGERLRLAPLLDQEARRLGHEEQRHEERDRGHRRRGEHPAPAGGPGEGEQPVDEVGEQDAGDDRHLVERDQPPADRARRDLGDVEGRQHGGHADREAAHEPRGHELGEVARHRRAHRGDGEEQRRDDQDALAAEAVGEPAGDGRPDRAADEQAGGGDLGAPRGEPQLLRAGR